MKRSKKIAILATILGLYCGSSTAQAAALLGVVNTDASYTSGKMAKITGSRVTTKVDLAASKDNVKDLNRDASLYPLVYNGQGMLALRQYTYSTTDLAPTRILDGDSDWNKPVYQGVFPSVANMHAAAGYKGFIFGTGYDLGKIGVEKVQPNGTTTEVYSVDLKQIINNKCQGNYDAAAGIHGESLGVKDGMLYVNASVNPFGGYGSYEDSYLMQFAIQSDGSLEFVSYQRTAKNPDNVRMNFYNNHILLTGIGGMQGYGTSNRDDTALSVAEIVGAKLDSVRNINVPEDVKNNNCDFRNLKVLPNGTAYVLMYVLGGSGSTTDTKVYKTTVSNLLSNRPNAWEPIVDEEAGGFFNSLDADYYTKRLYMECGNTVRIYTDGAADPLVWTPVDLTEDRSYVNFNGWAVVPADQVTGAVATAANLHTNAIQQKSLVQADYRNKLTGSAVDNTNTANKRNYKDATTDYKNYSFKTDKTIFTYTDLLGDLDTNVLATIDAHLQNDINLNAGTHRLQLQSLNYVGNPTGIYAGNGKRVTLTAGQVDILTLGADKGNSLTNAIWLDAPGTGSSSITINAPVNITMKGGLGGNGLAVQKTDRWAESSHEADTASTIILNGNLNILGADSTSWGIGLNEENVYSRFNNAGLLTAVDKSKILVNGDVDMSIYGNGITTNASDSIVTINGGGSIVVPKGMKYGYYTLGAYQGTINVNMGPEGKTPDTNEVKLEGDIFALKTGTVNLALTNSASYLKGMIDNGGSVNLVLEKGATWTNVANNTRYVEETEDVGSGNSSYVNVLKGGADKASAGVIYQAPDSPKLNIDRYSGNLIVLYNHDESQSIKGGDMAIASASAKAGITLRTDYSSALSTEAAQEQVLNNLANKLFYTGYTKGESNLTGSVEIAEGLTASAATKYVNGITFNKTTGQGSAGEQEPGTTTYSYLGALCPAVGTVENKDGHLVTGGAVCAEGATISYTNTAQVAGALHALKGGTITIGRDAQVGGAVVADKGTILLKRDLLAKGVIKAVNGGNLVIKGDSSKATAMKNDLIAKGSGSQVELNLLNKNDTLAGTVTASDGGKVNLNLKNGASWTGSNCSNNTELNLENSSWNNLTTQTNQLVKLTANKGVMDMSGASGATSVAKYSGNATLLYKHEDAQPSNIVGGNLEIGAAAAGSAITLQTDKAGINTSDAAQVKQILNNLAGKLVYSGAVKGEKNLNGTVKIAEGLTATSAALVTGSITYDSKGTGTYTGNGKAAAQTVKGTLSSESLTSNIVAFGDNALVDQQIVYGSEETAMMQGTKSAMADAVNVWRATSNNLLKRLGDLRLQQEEQGIWAKYYSGRSKLAEASNKYKAMQVGYDHSSKNWNLGLALEYVDGKASYGRGHGKAEVKNFGLYGTRQLGAGQYLDIIGKVGRIGSDFKVMNEMGHTLEGDFSTSAQSLSLEYGKTFKLKDSSFFVEPAVELTYGHNNARSYKATSDFEDGKPLTVYQQSFESLVSRLGLRLGQQKTGYSYYGRVQWCHEFSGNMKTGYEAEGEPTSSTRMSLKGNWTELELGGTVKLSRNNYVYGSAEKSFGGKLKTDWRFDLGLRWSF